MLLLLLSFLGTTLKVFSYAFQGLFPFCENWRGTIAYK